MILKASQRSGGAQLAVHLMKDENEHVTLHEVSGFVAADLAGAFKEVYAISKGTRCNQYLFSLSLNPPETEDVPVAIFEDAIARVEKKMGLSGQPRAIVFHEKQGRRHAHCVWSRIDAAQMKAINLPLYKRKLTELSRQIYLEQEWQMPPGFEDHRDRDPLNYSQAEAQQAKRAKRDTATLKALFQQCWIGSDSRTSFVNALREQRFVLARGDRRGYVAVDASGEVYSLSRWCGVKAKELRARLGDPATLPSIKEALGQHFTEPNEEPDYAQKQARERLDRAIERIEAERGSLVATQQRERKALRKAHSQRQMEIMKACTARLPVGLKATWARLTGTYQRVCAENAAMLRQAAKRDREEFQALVQRHLKARQSLQAKRFRVEQEFNHSLRTDKRTSTATLDETKGAGPAVPLRPILDPLQPLVLPPEDDHLTIAERVARDPANILDVIADKKEDFTRADILRALVPYVPNPTKLRLAADTALQAPQLVCTTSTPEPRFATEDFLSVKATLKAEARVMATSSCGWVSQKHIDTAIERQNAALQSTIGANLSAEQDAAIRHILDDAQLSCVIGLAGAGKSTMLSAARNAWQKQGFRVIGAALSGKAADGLQSASGIESRTLASLEHSWKNGYALLSCDDVLVIDEAGMVGTKQMARFVSAAKQAGAKLILVGDPEQLQPIQAGRPFKEVARDTGAAKLTEIRRQKEEWQRQASRDLAEGFGADALRTYETMGYVTVTTDTPEAIAQLTRDYVADAEKHGINTSRLALAHRRKDVHAINQAIRSLKKADGALSVETLFQTDHGPRAFATGDRVVFTRNDRDLGVKNGSFGTVEKVGSTQMVVRLDGEEETQSQTVTVAPDRFPAIDHGYACTIHKSQGVTIDKAYVLGSKSMDRHLKYVALTRHRQDMRLYCETGVKRRLQRNRRFDFNASVAPSTQKYNRSGPER